MTPPRATILIPLLNQVDAWLETCVRSAIEQSVPCDVLVVMSRRTGQSNRDVLARLQTTTQTLRVLERPRDGYAAGLNFGIANAACDRIALLLSDDWLEPSAVEACLERDADIVCAGRADFLGDGVTPLEGFGRALRMDHFEALPDLERKARYLTHLFVFKRSALERVGGVDESLGDSPGIDDYDLIWVLLEHGASVAIVEECLYNYRDHEGERLTTRNVEEMTRTMRRILVKHKVPDDQLEALLREHARWFGRSMQAAWRQSYDP